MPPKTEDASKKKSVSGDKKSTSSEKKSSIAAAGGAQPPNDAPPGDVQEIKPEMPINYKTLPVIEYLGMVDKLLEQALQVLVIERPENPADFLSDYLRENNPKKSPPVFYPVGYPPQKPSCGCHVGKPLPPTSCGCYHEPGWNPWPAFAKVGLPNRTSIDHVLAINTIALP